MKKKSYYESQLEVLNSITNVSGKKKFIDSIDFKKKIEKDSDANIINEMKKFNDMPFKDAKQVNKDKELEKGYIDNLICRKCLKYNPIDKLCEEHKNAIKDTDNCIDFEDNTEKVREDLKCAYLNIKDILRKYCDLEELDYPIIATWIIGTYFHHQFESFPYLFLNAMKGSGKTRTLKLITNLAKNGEMILSPTEAVLFRTNSTLGIDEFEGLTKKGYEKAKKAKHDLDNYQESNRKKRYASLKNREKTLKKEIRVRQLENRVHKMEAQVAPPPIDFLGYGSGGSRKKKKRDDNPWGL